MIHATGSKDQAHKENGKRDAAFDLAQYVVSTSYNDLHSSLIDITKKCILDTIGVAIAASGLEPAAKEIEILAKDGGGKPESTIIGFGGKVPC
jgi:2-methylcitrate dehydratase PrpD